MIVAEKVAHSAITTLLHWQSREGRQNLPWQNTHDPYAIWLSEIMLQQTQVTTVIDYFTKFINKFPTLSDLANTSTDEVLQYWAGLGYYRRAHQMHKAAIILNSLSQYPTTREGWQALPGVGRTTAAAIVSSAYGVPAAILDGNVKRVFSRVFLGIPQPSAKTLTSTHEKLLWEIADHMMLNPLASSNTRQWNQALMDLGSIVCRRQAQCEICPWSQKHIKNFCRAAPYFTSALFQKPSSLKTATRKIIPEDLWMLIWLRKHRGEIQLWLEKRPNQGLWAGLMCPPLMENDISCKFSALISTPQYLPSYNHSLTHRHFRVKPLMWMLTAKNINDHWKSLQTLIHKESATNGQWINIQERNQYGMPTLAKKALGFFH